MVAVAEIHSYRHGHPGPDRSERGTGDDLADRGAMSGAVPAVDVEGEFEDRLLVDGAAGVGDVDDGGAGGFTGARQLAVIGPIARITRTAAPVTV